MTAIERDVLDIPAGYRSPEAASFMAQLDDQSARLFHDLEGITLAELEWQPAPGMNTIGMLLAHNAIVEVFWTQLGPEGKPADIDSVIGIGMDDDGMPVAEGGLPPATLAGKPWKFYEELLGKARAYAKQAAQKLGDDELPTIRRRVRKNGNIEDFSIRWVLYHMLEHFAGHYGQILLLRHQHRVMRDAGTQVG